MARTDTSTRRRVRFAPMAIAIGVLSAAALGFSTTGTFAAFTATINNSANTASTGALNMKETDSTGTGTICQTASSSTNLVTCATINKYGGTGSTALTPGATAGATTVRIYDTGSLAPATFTLLPGTCTPSGGGGGDLCGQLKLAVTCQVNGTGTSYTVSSGSTLTALATAGSINIGTAAANCVPQASSANYVTFSFVVSMANGSDNTMQGVTASQPLTWQFTSA